MGSGGIAPRILNLSVNFTPQPSYPQEKSPWWWEGELDFDVATGAGIGTMWDFGQRVDGSEMYAIHCYENVSDSHYEKNGDGLSEGK
jgi:hypothetical protein